MLPNIAMAAPGSSYATSKDFVAFFLQSPITKEPEIEIRISAENAAVVNSFYESLRKQNIPFRKLGLPVFPPPLMLLLEYHLAKRALQVLRSWYDDVVREGKNLPRVEVTKPDGSIVKVNESEQITKLIEII